MKYLLFLFITLSVSPILAQRINPAEVIDAQLKAYNDRDIDAFVATYSPYVEIYEYGHDRPFMVGREQLRSSYAVMFLNSPDLHAEVSERIVQGHRVIDHETASGINGGSAFNVVVIYELTDGLISKVTFMY